jgi:hypothetical protein
MKDFNQKFALYISAIFSPYIVIAVFSLIIIEYLAPTFEEFINWAGIFILFSVLIPLIYVFISVKKNRITDIHVFAKEQRMIPFIVAVVGSVLVLMYYIYSEVPTALIATILTLILNGAFFALTSKYYKLSIHTAAFASSLTMLALIINVNWLILSPILILIIWSRMYRKRHTFIQLISSAIISSVLTSTILLLAN